MVCQQKIREHLPVPLVVVDPVEAGLLDVGDQRHCVGYAIQIELLLMGNR